jgi:DNA-binding CsgD family transcriptional regulator
MRSPPRAPSIPAPALVGRGHFLEQLAETLRPPYAGAAVVLIEGPAGIGKTSLVRAGVTQADAAGATVLYAHPVEAEVTFAYATLVDLLGPEIGFVETHLSAPLGEALVRALRADEAADPVQPAGVPAPEGLAGENIEPDRVAMAVLAAFRGLAARNAALLIVIDDAPWVDQASREALTFALRRVSDLPIRLLVAQRAEVPGGPLPFGLAEAVRRVHAERIWLEPLSMGALHQLLREATGASFSRPMLLRIHELSGGNPFYARELGRSVAASGTTPHPGQDVRVPSSLRALVGARVQQLPAATRRLLLAAALSARPTLSLLAAFSSRDPGADLQPAMEAGVIRLEGGRVTFAHPLYASELVADASAADVRSMHAWLGRAADEDLESRARHLALASDGRDEQVADALARAAGRARRRGAPSVAAALLDMAVDRTPPDSPERAERALAAAEAWFVAGDLKSAWERAAALVPMAHGTLRARALLRMGLATWYTGTAQDAVVDLSHALADAAGDRALQGLIEYYLSIFSDYDLEAARHHAMAAAELLAGTADRGHLAAAKLQTFYWSVLLGRRPPVRLLAEGLKIEAEGPLTDRLTSPGIWWAAIGRLDLARDRFQHMLDFDVLHGEYANTANLLTRLAEVELWAGDWPAARRQATAAIEADYEIRAEPGEMAPRALALVDACEGRLEEAFSAATAGVERMQRAGDPTLTAAWLQVTALVYATRQDAEGVAAATAQAARLLASVGFREPLRLDPAPERIEALALLGRLEEAAAELAGLEQRQHRVAKPWAAAAIARGRARIALARGDADEAVAATNAVASGDATEWSRFDVARILLVRGESLRHARSRRRAADTLRRAEALFEALGASAWAARAGAEQARLGLLRSEGLALTATEARVAQLAGDGLSTREVAAELGISPRTVESHLASVYGKLGVESRAALGRAMAAREATPG